MCIVALEHAIKMHNAGKKARIIFAAPTREDARNIILPIMAQVMEDMPDDLRPEWVESRHRYVFPWGDELVVDGADDDRGNHLRGPMATLVLGDECGFWRYLRYVINSVLLPQTITCNGRIVLASTSPESVGHEWYEFVTEAQQNGAYVRKTIYDNPTISPELLDEYAKESGGYDSATFRREYLCEAVTETERQVVPEFEEALHVVPHASIERPAYSHRYVVMDLGLIDYTHALFSFYDFGKAQLVIEDEYCDNYKPTDDIARAIHAKMHANWPESMDPEWRKKWVRLIADNDPQQLMDLARAGLAFSGAEKQDSEALLNQMRIMMKAERIVVSDRCVKLIHQLKVGVWNARRTDYERLPGAGHLDGIDALKYMVRHVDYSRNPSPLPIELASVHTHHHPQLYDAAKRRQARQSLKGAFGPDRFMKG